MRLNRKLQDEVGERLFEKLGKKWALTRFAFEVYGTSLADEPSAVDVVPELFDEEAR
jgi:hypothetical protein